jgi:hypothetical protein
MASSPGIAKPGTKYGPCAVVKKCTHYDCAASYRVAGSVCRICNKHIEYETRFYFEDGNQPVHGLCLDLEVERQQL